MAALIVGLVAVLGVYWGGGTAPWMSGAVMGLLGAPPALAQQAAEDAYTARGVAIAATDENAAVARDRAIASGQVQALGVVLERIADPAQAATLPQVTREQVLPMVETYSLADERTTDTSYSARLTVQFNGPAVRRLLDQRGIGHAAEASQPVLVVPVFQAGPDRAPVLWEDTNPWLTAWRRHDGASVLLPVEVPTGDLSDVTTLSPEQALEPDGAALAKLLARYGRDTVLLAHAVRSGPDALQVSLHYGSPRAMARTGAETLSRQQGEDDAAFLRRAANTVAQRLEADWRDANLVHAGAGHQVTALASLGGFTDWMAIRRGLEHTPLIRQVSLQAMTKTLAQLTLTVQGDSTRVAQALALQGLTLSVHGTYWLITRAGAADIAPGASTSPASGSAWGGGENASGVAGGGGSAFQGSGTGDYGTGDYGTGDYGTGGYGTGGYGTGSYRSGGEAWPRTQP